MIRAVTVLSLVAFAGCKGPPVSGAADAGVAEPVTSVVAATRVDAAGSVDDGAAADASGPLDAASALDRELTRRTDAARVAFGPTTLVRREAGSFLLVAADPGAPLDGVAGTLHKSIAALVRPDRFRQLPDEATTVLVFTRVDSYEAHAPQGTLGYFKPGSREIDLDASFGKASWPTATHELVHSLMSRDWGPPPAPPKVVRECVAGAFENPWFTPPDGIRALRSGVRMQTFRTALGRPADREATRLPVLLAMDDAKFEARFDYPGRDEWAAARNEAVARYLCVMLDEKGWLWPFYRHLRDTPPAERDVGASLAAAAGMTVEQVNAVFLAWARGV